jgi:circadian clock protein KaiC
MGNATSIGRAVVREQLAKAPSGIRGLDELTRGGLPRGRPTLVCGAAGCGKTLLAMEFIVRGVVDHGEPGVFVAFEETAEELTRNVSSLGFDLDALVAQGLMAIDHVEIDRSQIEENGEYDLDGLFIRLGYAIDSIGARRVVLDTIETLFGGLSDQAVLRAELRRLFAWLKQRGVTAVITAERGDGVLTRQGLEEYVSDCVILLDHRVVDQVSTRLLRIVKYRGAVHGTNEYPFLIDETGLTLVPITSLGLDHLASEELVSTGILELDAMLGGKGLYRGSSALVSGTAGTGKSSVAAHIAAASCSRGERCLYFAFEESPAQITRNMRSVGLDLRPWIERGLLRLVAGRPTSAGSETHLALMHRHVREFEPRLVVVDPISNLADAGAVRDATAVLTRLLDFLKARQITAVLTSLTGGDQAREATSVGISSVIDTWLLLRDIELGGERNRGIYVLKSRGMAHSNQIREFLITPQGVQLKEVYVGPEGVLTGSMRVAQQRREQAAEEETRRAAQAQLRAAERKRREVAAQIAALQLDLEEVDAAVRLLAASEDERQRRANEDRVEMSISRKAEAPEPEVREARDNVESGARN